MAARNRYRQQLYQWNFTVPDFEVLIKTLHAYSTYKTKALYSSDTPETMDEIKEMRIPVALPKGIIDERSHP